MKPFPHEYDVHLTGADLLSVHTPRDRDGEPACRLPITRAGPPQHYTETSAAASYDCRGVRPGS